MGFAKISAESEVLLDTSVLEVTSTRVPRNGMSFWEKSTRWQSQYTVWCTFVVFVLHSFISELQLGIR